MLHHCEYSTVRRLNFFVSKMWLASDFCTAVGQLPEPEEHRQGCPMSTTQSLLNTSPLLLVGHVARALCIHVWRKNGLAVQLEMCHSSTRPPNVRVVTAHDEFYPALGTNSGARRPGNKANYGNDYIDVFGNIG